MPWSSRVLVDPSRRGTCSNLRSAGARSERSCFARKGRYGAMLPLVRAGVIGPAETPARLRKRSERRALSGIGSRRASGCRR